MNCGQGAERSGFYVQALGSQGNKAAALWRWDTWRQCGNIEERLHGEPFWEKRI